MQVSLGAANDWKLKIKIVNSNVKNDVCRLQNKAEVKVDLSSYQSKILKLEAELK